MKRLLFWIVTMALILGGAGSALAAGSATGSLTVSATANTNCRIESPVNVSFSTPYDSTNPADNTSGAGSFDFRCTRGTSYSLYIVRTNTMTFGADSLTYELYEDAGLTNVWGTNLGSATAGGPSLNNSAVTKNIYGRIGALQDVLSGGPYTETVLVTVDW